MSNIQSECGETVGYSLLIPKIDLLTEKFEFDEAGTWASFTSNISMSMHLATGNVNILILDLVQTYMPLDSG